MTTTTAAPPVTIADPVRGESLWTKARKRFVRHKLAMAGLIVLITMVLLSTFAGVVAPYSPNALDLTARSQPPSQTHALGTDSTGRDTLSRLLHAGQVSLSVGLVAVTISTFIGIVIGAVAGYFGGAADMILMRMTDMVMVFPPLVIIIAVAAVAGPSIYNTMIIIGMLSWPATARLVRGQFLSLREQQFVTAARAIGVPPAKIIFKHVFPNVIGTVAVAATFGVASAILLEASLSFLGMGVQMPTPSWGNMLREAQTLTILEGMPWLWILPGLMIALSVLSINFIGDGMRDALDPRTQI